MQYTDNTKLNMPEENDFYNVQDLNANMDILDNASMLNNRAKMVHRST